jgi:uncharacterized membrane protein YeaQ/YmgE (transglycosylase-associated protein family)
MGIYWSVLIGMTAGWLAGQLMTGKGFGLVGDLIAGATGALIAGVLFEKTGIWAGSGFLGTLVVATTGAMVLLFGVRMVKKA